MAIVRPLSHLSSAVTVESDRLTSRPGISQISMQLQSLVTSSKKVGSFREVSRSFPRHHSELHFLTADQFRQPASEESHPCGVVARSSSPQVDVRERGSSRQQSSDVDQGEFTGPSDYRSARQNTHVAYPLGVPRVASDGGATQLLEVEEEGVQTDELWLEIRREARAASEEEPILASFFYSTVLAHRSLERSLAFHLANKLSCTTLLSSQLFSLVADTFTEDKSVRIAVRADLLAYRERDAACETYVEALLNYKGFLALQSYRVAHRLWGQGREGLALALQSRISEVFHVDIHPAARIGKGVMFDHATGLVIGETAEVGNDVSILHHVTLGGTGAVGCDRHPKVGDGVLIGAGATLLGPIVVGTGAKIGAGSLVLSDVPPRATAVGNPARLMGGKKNPSQLAINPSDTMDQTSFIGEWSGYTI